MSPETRPYGSWRSPITSDLTAGETVGLAEVILADEATYWLEMRPSEEGRHVVVRRDPEGRVSDVLAPPWNARTRVHEYGGGSYAVDSGVLYFTHFQDQRVYRLDPGEEPRPLTPPGARRYADLTVDPRRNRLLAVREDHSSRDREAMNTLVAVDTEGEEADRLLAEGRDFYAAPRISPEGDRVAWLAWDHPNMPWDGTELWVAKMGPDGLPKQETKVAGGLQESVFQPAWSPDGTLHFVSDRTGWWNLYRYRKAEVEPLHPMEAEFGQPQWLFGLSTYDFAGPDRIVCGYNREGTWRLALLAPGDGTLSPLETPFTVVHRYLRASHDRAVFLGASPTEFLSVVALRLDTGEVEVWRRSTDVRVDAGYLSVPRPVAYATEGGERAHGFFYPPRNRDFRGPEEEDPPLLVAVHGGPTSAVTSSLQLPIQYWTSRGFAYLDVNYRGSTGYGRAYRERLKGAWGVADVDDAVHGARHLVREAEADGRRLAIRGGSAGGYTVLCALAFRDAFHAGTSFYGVSDLEAMARETHKFESRYLDGLVGPYPERQDRYRARSPLLAVDRISRPLLLFQGLEDAVVPPSQSEDLYRALVERGVPVAYVAFEGEQHGFRRAETIRRALDAELFFYGRVFGFVPGDPVEPVDIANLPSGEGS